MFKSRDISTAWNSAKRQVGRAHPDRFWLDGMVLRPASAKEDRPRENLSAAGHRKLATLATKEGMTPGAVYDYVIGRDPFPPVGTRRRKLVVLAEERQAFVPARAATLAAGVHRAWARGLDAVARGVACAVAATARDDVERTGGQAVDAVPGGLVGGGGATVAGGRST
jgi:hypothetical protein